MHEYINTRIIVSEGKCILFRGVRFCGVGRSRGGVCEGRGEEERRGEGEGGREGARRKERKGERDGGEGRWGLLKKGQLFGKSA